MTALLIASEFPGIDLLGMAFEQEMPEVCVMRGPDPIYGGDVRTHHLPVGVFWGVIGGPPCQAFSRMRHINPNAGRKHGNLIPEFERLCAEAQPTWFLMENVRDAPAPTVPGYLVRSLLVNNRWLPGGEDGIGAEQHRERRFSFGTRDGRRLCLEVAALEAPRSQFAVTSSARQIPVALQRDGNGGHRPKTALRGPTGLSGHGAALGQRDRVRQRSTAVGAGHSNLPGEPSYSVAEMCRLQGLPETFADELPFTVHGKRKAIGNGVCLFTGRAVARAVLHALHERTR